MVETLLYLNDSLLTSAVRIIGLVRNLSKANARFSHYRERKDFQLLVTDVCDKIDVEGPVDYVIHAASQASPKYFGADPVGTLSANVFGTQNLLELAREKKKLADSCSFAAQKSTENSLRKKSLARIHLWACRPVPGPILLRRGETDGGDNVPCMAPPVRSAGDRRSPLSHVRPRNGTRRRAGVQRFCCGHRESPKHHNQS